MDMAKNLQPTAQENGKDSEEILEDQDQTNFEDKLTRDENMGAKTYSLDTLEDEPADFARGEVDVKSQMDRAERQHDSAIYGYQGPNEGEGPEGGLEEVIQKTEQALAKSRHPRPARH